MRLAPTLTAIAVAIALVGLSLEAAATPNVEVSYEHPEKFRDASLRDSGYGADEFVLKEIRSTFERLGERYLPAGQTLRIDVQDIDLAGRYEPWRSYAYDVRFMRDITWPSLRLRYALSQDGKPLANGEARVNDMFYLQRPGRATHSNDRLYAEKAMLEEWFRKQFGDQHVSSRK